MYVVLTKNHLCVPLNDPSVLSAVFRLVPSNVRSDLYGLCLENNDIGTGDGLACVREFFPNLRALDLSDNKVNGDDFYFAGHAILYSYVFVVLFYANFLADRFETAGRSEGYSYRNAQPVRESGERHCRKQRAIYTVRSA